METITPVVNGGRSRWLGTLTLHTFGAAATASAFGATLGWIGGKLHAPWGRSGLLVVVAVAVLYALGELTPLHVPVPQLRRQVPDWWRTFFGRHVASSLYGAGLGVGFLTYLAHGTFVVVALVAIASGRPAMGALVVAPFGLVRGLSPIVGRRSVTPEQRRTLVDRLATSPGSRRRIVNGVALFVVAGTALVAAPGAPSGGEIPLASGALASTLAVAALSKTIAWRRWRRALSAHRLPSTIERVATWAAPLGEAIVPTLILVGLARPAAAWSAVLLGVFSLELVRIRLRVGDRVPCGCFGGRETVGLASALLRNAAIGVLAVFVWTSGAGGPAVAWPALTREDVLPMLLSLGASVAAMLATWRASVWLGRGART
ncbi:MAG: MauE/DoxX family redox-associated membrane protein [Actinomycetota bacterium]